MKMPSDVSAPRTKRGRGPAKVRTRVTTAADDYMWKAIKTLDEIKDNQRITKAQLEPVIDAIRQQNHAISALRSELARSMKVIAALIRGDDDNRLSVEEYKTEHAGRTTTQMGIYHNSRENRYY